jgi:hypothetical protein
MFNNHKKPLFGFKPIVPHLIIVAIALAAFYVIAKNNLFLSWLIYIYYAAKVLIIFEIIIASARSFLAPILGIVAALGILSIEYFYTTLSMVSVTDGWQLLIASAIGLLISVLMRL